MLVHGIVDKVHSKNHETCRHNGKAVRARGESPDLLRAVAKDNVNRVGADHANRSQMIPEARTEKQVQKFHPWFSVHHMDAHIRYAIILTCTTEIYSMLTVK